MKQYTHLLFDLDGTLFDFDAAERAAFYKTCEEFHLPYSPELMTTYTRINESYWKLFEQGKVTQPELAVRRFADLYDYLQINGDPVQTNLFYRRSLGESSTLFPDALPVCRKLSSKYTLAFITNGIADVQNRRLSGCPLMELTSHVFISEAIGSQKPQKQYFDYVYDKLSIKPSQALVIGDSLTSDILGAQNTNTDSCWYNPHNKQNTYAHIHPTFEISRLDQLLSFLLTE